MSFLLFVLALLLAPPAGAAERKIGEARPWPHAGSDLAVDPAVRFGSLENGVRYAWQRNAEPRARSYLRMHVDVGSLAEEEDELGMAHFLEHMAFNGSEHFPAGSLVEWLQQRGMDFGAHSNAATGFAETVYMLDLPESDAASLENGLRVLADFAGNLLLEEKEIEAEKGVIDGEERERESAAFRAAVDGLKRQLAGTRLAARVPIGTKAARDAFDGAKVRRFYQRWYRPENLTVILIGDFGADDPTPLIEAAFGALQPPESPPESPPSPGVPTFPEPFFAIHAAEIPTVSLTLARMKPYQEKAPSKARALEDLPLEAARRMLNLRLAEIVRSGKAPFLMAHAGSGDLLECADGEQLSISCEEARWREALAACDAELRRAIQHGFGATELEEVRARALRSLADAVAQESTRNSGELAEALVEAASSPVVPMAPAARRALFEPAWKGLAPEQCQKALAQAWSEGAPSLTAMGPLDLGPEAGKVLEEAYAECAKVKVEPRAAAVTQAFAYASDPKAPAPAAERSALGSGDVELVQFENGVRAYLKTTDFEADTVRVAALVGEGLLSLPRERQELAMLGRALLDAGGLGRHDATELRRLFAGRAVEVDVEFERNRFRVGGRTTPSDLLTQLELMRATIADPGYREEARARFLQAVPQMYESLRHQLGGPIANGFVSDLHGGDPRFKLPERAALELASSDDVRGWIDPQFADGPITVLVVGAFQPDAAVAALARTFGTLPQRRARETRAADREVAPMKTGYRASATVESETPSSLVHVVFPTTDGIDAQRRAALYCLGRVLNDRVRLEIREKLGATYAPQAGAESSRVFPGEGSLTITALSEPGKEQDLVGACLGVAELLAKDGVTPEETERLREPLLAAVRDQERDNGWWIELLGVLHERPDGLPEELANEERYRAVDAKQLSELAARYLEPERASLLVVETESAPAK